MIEKQSKKKKKTDRKASVVVISNKPEAPLSHDRDFMKALRTFNMEKTLKRQIQDSREWLNMNSTPNGKLSLPLSRMSLNKF